MLDKLLLSGKKKYIYISFYIHGFSQIKLFGGENVTLKLRKEHHITYQKKKT